MFLHGRWSGRFRCAARTALDLPRASRPARLASVVVEELAPQIISGTLPEGSLLPTEGRSASSSASAGRSCAKG